MKKSTLGILLLAAGAGLMLYNKSRSSKLQANGEEVKNNGQILPYPMQFKVGDNVGYPIEGGLYKLGKVVEVLPQHYLIQEYGGAEVVKVAANLVVERKLKLS